ncbi:MAG: A/G-specific adenine glycosylase [Microbacteriaceae bacterium]|nr:A/G-specific adenine glycosylase [Microbacteriaceae bacterium]MCI1207172.1 A/G-specific adenine glycosylase [Microbacteriaceae bacterium]
MSDAQQRDPAALGRAVSDWYRHHARDLPWRRRETTPWGVLVSEFMLQQTQVSRVLPRWEEWMRRWPTPEALAREEPAEIIRAWGRLGYPRRALWLHNCAIQITEKFDGKIPDSPEVLRTLPGIGPYTAAAVASFAYRIAVPVVDTNVRRVLVRVRDGRERADPGPRDRTLLEGILPERGDEARIVSLAFMEIGALVCTASAPACGRCPLQNRCRWLASGSPAGEPHRRKQPRYAGSLREARGRILGELRNGPTTVEALRTASDDAQTRQALESLLADGLAIRIGGYLTLPGDRRPLSRPDPERTPPR